MLRMDMSGHAWRFGGLLDVDWEICPRHIDEELRRSGVPYTDQDLGKYCMSVLDPDFSQRVAAGDFLVGDVGFGYGHDHFHACRSIKGCGVSAVLCESATSYFLRNCFNHGLLVLEVPGIFAATTTGDELAIDLANSSVTNKVTGWRATFPEVPGFLLELVEAGSVYELVKQGR